MAAPKKCSKCGEHTRMGGDPEKVGKAVDLCRRCLRASFDEGRCPFCGFGLKTKTHAEKCVTASQAA